MSPIKRVTKACALSPRCDPIRMARSKVAKVAPAQTVAATIAVTVNYPVYARPRVSHHGSDGPRTGGGHDQWGEQAW